MRPQSTPIEAVYQDRTTQGRRRRAPVSHTAAARMLNSETMGR